MAVIEARLAARPNCDGAIFIVNGVESMIIAGFTVFSEKSNAVEITHSILSKSGARFNILDSKNISSRNLKILKNYIRELEHNGTEILILNINRNCINNPMLDALNYDILVYAGNDEYLLGAARIYSKLKEKDAAVVNVDDEKSLLIMKGVKTHVITYGFNPKASITASSVGEITSGAEIICCLQRNITAKNGRVIEPQEFPVFLPDYARDSIYDALSAVSFAILCGIDIKNFHRDFQVEKYNI